MEVLIHITIRNIENGEVINISVVKNYLKTGVKINSRNLAKVKVKLDP
jgi:outer membrane protein W